MSYAFEKEQKLGKTYTIPGKFTALNGTIQYYTLTFTDAVLTSSKEIDDNSSDADKLEVATAQANLLRALEVLRTYGGQPVITKAEGKVLEFTLEQANVFGDNTKTQPSAKDLRTEAQTQIETMFSKLKTVDGKSFACKAVVHEAF